MRVGAPSINGLGGFRNRPPFPILPISPRDPYQPEGVCLPACNAASHVFWFGGLMGPFQNSKSHACARRPHFPSFSPACDHQPHTSPWLPRTRASRAVPAMTRRYGDFASTRPNRECPDAICSEPAASPLSDLTTHAPRFCVLADWRWPCHGWLHRYHYGEMQSRSCQGQRAPRERLRGRERGHQGQQEVSSAPWLHGTFGARQVFALWAVWPPFRAAGMG